MKSSRAPSNTIIRAAVALSVVVARPALSSGPVFNVNSTADAPDTAINGICDTGGTCNGVPCCTLRAAIMEANFNFSGEEVTIDLPAGTYKLTIPIGPSDNQGDGDLDILGHVRIVGAGFDLSIIDANHVDRAILVGSGAVATLQDLRVQGGRPPASQTRYGKGAGGGILNAGGSLVLRRCLVRDNVAAAGSDGGGILSSDGSLTLEDSIVRVNTAPPPYGDGGGIYASGSATTISRSIVNANTAALLGGGIIQYGGSIRIVNSTISQNVAAEGGGIALSVANVAALNSVTIATNTATADYPAGTGAYFYYSTPVVSNSLLNDDVLCFGTGSITSNGYNVISQNSGCSIAGSYLSGYYLLDPLAFNGGLTATHALPVPSYMIDAGDPSGCVDPLGAQLATDQRGVKRKIGAACDLGAFEAEPIGDANGDGTVNVADVLYLINYLFAGGPVPLGRANVNADGAVNVADVLYLINYLFAGGQAPVG